VGVPVDAGVLVAETGVGELVGVADAEGPAATGVGPAGAWPAPVAAAGSCVVSLVTCVSCVAGAGWVGLAGGVRVAIGPRRATEIFALLESILRARAARSCPERCAARAAVESLRSPALTGCERSLRTTGSPLPRASPRYAEAAGALR
jgi:hypothetical protein